MTRDNMWLDYNRVETLGQLLADDGLTDRHRRRTQQEYETIFGVATTPESGRGNLDLIFNRVIQARATPLGRDRYLEILDDVSPADVIAAETHQDAFDILCNQPQIGQKIANELLRHVVDVFGVRRSEWGDQLDIALDTHVIQGLVKTGAIVLEDSEEGRAPNRIVNTNPESNPNKLIGYQAVQDAFQQAADEAGFRRIVFDELWLEHRAFIDDPLLQSESVFEDLIEDRFREDN